MTLVPLLEINEADAADVPALEAGQAAYGQLLNTWRAIANRPGMFATYLPFLRTVAGPGELAQPIKELTAVRVGILNGCRYTVSHRCTSALAQGVSEEQLIAVAAGDFTSFDPKTRLALELTDQLTLDVGRVTIEDRPAGVEPTALASIREVFSPAEIVELTMGISIWNALSRFHRVMGFALDMPAAPAAVEASLYRRQT